jgi:hypothetical protein
VDQLCDVGGLYDEEPRPYVVELECALFERDPPLIGPRMTGQVSEVVGGANDGALAFRPDPAPGDEDEREEER